MDIVNLKQLLGREARGSDGGRVGKIIDVEEVESGRFLMIERGHLAPRDHYVPASEISRIGVDHVYLREPADFYNSGGDVTDARPIEDRRGERGLVGSHLSGSHQGH